MNRQLKFWTFKKSPRGDLKLRVPGTGPLPRPQPWEEMGARPESRALFTGMFVDDIPKRSDEWIYPKLMGLRKVGDAGFKKLAIL